MVQPYDLRPLLPSHHSGMGEHKQDLCEMCQELGYNCRQGVREDIEDDDDTESVVSTISTLSNVSASNLTPTGSDNERSQSGSDTEDELVEDLLSLKLTKK